MNISNALAATVVVSALLTGCSEPIEEALPEDQVTSSAPALQSASTAWLPDEPPTARLPDGVTPTHYTLHLNINPNEERFSGKTVIDLELTDATDFFWLHGDDLAVSSALARLPDGQTVSLAWSQESTSGTAKLAAESTLPAGKLSLVLDYNAPFNTSLEGLYKVDKASGAYAFTQFEATSARLAFPSFDEPAFKVRFDISLTIPEDHVGITNTPQVSESLTGDGFKTLTFATTKPLPTYLIAFAVGPFDVVEWQSIPATAQRAEPIPLRGITTRGKGEEIHFAMENTANIVAAMEAYFDTPYPYAKLDIIAVPDFSAGAMENAGAITYREQLILLDETASARQKRSFFVTHAHELAHQWFGNLVTPVWWDDIWLNEAFATWHSHIILDELYPDEKYRESLQNSASGVMRSDSLASARQIREPIEKHEDIGSAFNGITYRKGGGVLSMFESFLGRDNFRQGLRGYMKAFAWGNTTAEDFIGAIAEANPQVNAEDLRAAFDSFILQPGLPVISADLQCSDDGVQVHFDQRRYLPAGSEGSTDATWVVPACVSTMTGDDTDSQCFLLKEKSESVTLNAERCPEAVLPNTAGNSYYRWALPPRQWQALMQRFDQLSTNEQISVTNSLSAAVNDGSISLPDYLSAVPAIAGSDSWRVALAPRGDLRKIRLHVATEEERAELEASMRLWYRPRLEALQAIESRTAEQDQFLAGVTATLALAAEDPGVRGDGLKAAVAYTGFGGDEELRPALINPNTRLSSLIVAVEEQGKPFTDLLWRHFVASDNALEREHLLYAMASTKDVEVATQMRERILAPELNDNEILYVFAGLMSRKEHQGPTWDWTRENLDAVLERLPKWRKGKLPDEFESFCSRERASEVGEFFTPFIGTLESGPRYLANSLEHISLCAAFVDLHRGGNASDEPHKQIDTK